MGTEYETYLFFGYLVGAKTFRKWKRKFDANYCPFCGRALNRRYGNHRRHIRSCKLGPPSSMSKDIVRLD